MRCWDWKWEREMDTEKWVVSPNEPSPHSLLSIHPYIHPPILLTETAGRCGTRETVHIDATPQIITCKQTSKAVIQRLTLCRGCAAFPRARTKPGKPGQTYDMKGVLCSWRVHSTQKYAKENLAVHSIRFNVQPLHLHITILYIHIYSVVKFEITNDLFR